MRDEKRKFLLFESASSSARYFTLNPTSNGLFQWKVYSDANHYHALGQYRFVSTSDAAEKQPATGRKPHIKDTRPRGQGFLPAFYYDPRTEDDESETLQMLPYIQWLNVQGFDFEFGKPSMNDRSQQATEYMGSSEEVDSTISLGSDTDDDEDTIAIEEKHSPPTNSATTTSSTTTPSTSSSPSATAAVKRDPESHKIPTGSSVIKRGSLSSVPVKRTSANAGNIPPSMLKLPQYVPPKKVSFVEDTEMTDEEPQLKKPRTHLEVSREYYDVKLFIEVENRSVLLILPGETFMYEIVCFVTANAPDKTAKYKFLVKDKGVRYEVDERLRLQSVATLNKDTHTFELRGCIVAEI